MSERQKIEEKYCFRIWSNIKESLAVFSLRFWCHSPIWVSDSRINSIGQKITGPDSPIGFLYIRAKAKVKAIIFFDLLPLTHHCSINTQIGDNVTDRKRRRFRSNINAPLERKWKRCRFHWVHRHHYLSVYIKATAAATKINRFSINEPQGILVLER